MIEYMSALYTLPAFRPTRQDDRIDALREAARRNLAVIRSYGLLDDPDGDAEPIPAADLLDRIEDQDTSGLTEVGWLDRLQALVRVEAHVVALKAATIAAFDDATHGVSADLGHETPEPDDRLAKPAERRWHGGLLRSVSDEIGLVLQLHRSAANVRIAQSWELTHNHPRILAALSDGLLTERAAFTLVDELSTLTDESQLREAETALLDWAKTHPLQRIKQAARREAARRDAAALDRIRTRTLSDRSIRMISDNCGVADLISTHDAVHAAAAMTSLTNAAMKLRRAGDERTLDQLRADIALHRMLGNPDHALGNSDGAHGSPGHTLGNPHHALGNPGHELGHPAHPGHAVGNPGHRFAESPDQQVASSLSADRNSPGGSIPSPSGQSRVRGESNGVAGVEVVIHASAAELDAILHGLPGSGGELDGLGPLPQSALADALTKTTGPLRSKVRWHLADRVPESNPERYSPSAELDRWVRHRDRRCRFPGCNRPAAFCDLDHREPFAPNDPAGGRTTAANLHALCRHHHRLKHRGGWTIRRNPDGTTTWTSPTGREYTDDSDADP